MPISNEQFERMETIDTDGPTLGTNAAAILGFLRRHPQQAFTQSEIADATDVTLGSVGPTLVRLRERGRVDHRGTYWRVSDHELSVRAAAGHAADSVRSRETEDEVPAMKRWESHAVDPREHRNE